jgi:8-oxo-dGTP pyrophosphatase MutT (NUDIX family)
VASSDDGSTVPTPSATVVLVRDAAGAGGIEVLLLERHLRSDFAGGALVFPGGKVAAEDAALPPTRWRTSADLDVDADELGLTTSEEALAHRVAAVRETFEEAGVLLASREDGTAVTAADLATDGFQAARAALIDRGPVTDWQAWLEAERLVLDLDALAFWGWWVTPRGQHRRFDTRFFLAQLPDAQRHVAAHDEVEVTSARWLTPQRALELQATGEVTIIFPTRVNLRDLGVFSAADEVFAHAAAGRSERRRIEPTSLVVDGQVLVRHPYRDEPEPI